MPAARDAVHLHVVGRGQHLICVYVFNSFDMEEVKQVLHTLQSMGMYVKIKETLPTENLLEDTDGLLRPR